MSSPVRMVRKRKLEPNPKINHQKMKFKMLSLSPLIKKQDKTLKKERVKRNQKITKLNNSQIVQN